MNISAKNAIAAKRNQTHRQSVPLEQAGEKRRPAILAVSVRAQLAQELRDVHGELMRRRVLASVVAVAAIEAEVGEIDEIGFAENSALLHRREHGAVTLAVAAGVADRHLPRAVFN
jgi:hypothetical protein